MMMRGLANPKSWQVLCVYVSHVLTPLCGEEMFFTALYWVIDSIVK